MLSSVLLVVNYILPKNNNNKKKNPFAYKIPMQTEEVKVGFLKHKTIKLPLKEAIAFKLSQGIFHILEGKNVVKLNLDGKIINSFNLPNRATSFTIDDDNNYIIALKNRLFVYRQNGKKIKELFDFGENSFITAIAYSAKFIFCADSANRLVWQLTKSGSLVRQIGGTQGDNNIKFIVPSPFFDLLVNAENLWVTNPGKRRIECYNFNGKLLKNWGYHSLASAGFCGCCNPTTIAMDRNNKMITAEKGLVRVKQYDLKGNLLTMIAEATNFSNNVKGLDIEVNTHGYIFILDPLALEIHEFRKLDEK